MNEMKINSPLDSPEIIALQQKRDRQARQDQWELDQQQYLINKFNKIPYSLNLKIGKYKISYDKGCYGVQLTFEEGKRFLSKVTLNNVNTLYTALGIVPTKIFLEIAPRVHTYETNTPTYSYYIYGEYNNIPIVVSRKETSSYMAGQTYLISPYYKGKLNLYLRGYDGYESNDEIKHWVVKDFKLGETNNPEPTNTPEVDEIKRMQELAGISEIKISDPNSIYSLIPDGELFGHVYEVDLDDMGDMWNTAFEKEYGHEYDDSNDDDNDKFDAIQTKINQSIESNLSRKYNKSITLDIIS